MVVRCAKNNTGGSIILHFAIRSEGKAYPPPLAVLPAQHGVGDGYPDYPWFFGTGSGYIVYPLVVAGMWETAMGHLRLLRDVSRAINGSTGKVVHEVSSDGTVYFGNNASKGDINEIGLFATAVDLRAKPGGS